MKGFFACLALLLFTACAPVVKPLHHTLDVSLNTKYDSYDLQSSRYLSIDALADKLKFYSVLFIGDHHDQDDLHLKIAALLKALQKRGKKVLLASEWFSSEQNPLLQEYHSKRIDEKSFLEQTDWQKRIHFDFASFKPLYEAVQRGTLLGMNLTKKARQKISQRATEEMSASEKAFYQNLDLKVSIHYDALKDFFEHCHAYSKGGEECSERMYRVQVAWDSKMAEEAYGYARKLKEDEVLVVFAGAMHLENKLGINLRFSRLSDLPTFSLIPLEKGEKEAAHGLADALIFYEKRADKKL